MSFLKENLSGKVSKSMWSLWIILIGIFGITGLVDHYFFSIPSIGVTLQLAAPLGLLAAGQTICMLTGGIDLSIAIINILFHNKLKIRCVKQIVEIILFIKYLF